MTIAHVSGEALAKEASARSGDSTKAVRTRDEREASCRERRQATAEGGSAAREPAPTRGVR